MTKVGKVLLAILDFIDKRKTPPRMPYVLQFMSACHYSLILPRKYPKNSPQNALSMFILPTHDQIQRVIDDAESTLLKIVWMIPTSSCEWVST